MTDRITLTAEQAVRMARATALFVATDHGQHLDAAYDDPQTVRDIHEAMAPYVALIRELQDELEVTQTETLRIVAERLMADASEALECERRAGARAHADPEWQHEDITLADGDEMSARYMDDKLADMAIASAVLARIEGEEG